MKVIVKKSLRFAPVLMLMTALSGCTGKTDQQILEWCINSLKEGSRGSSLYGELRLLETKVNKVRSIEVETRFDNYSRKMRRATLLSVNFYSDGEPTSLACVVPTDWVN